MLGTTCVLAAGLMGVLACLIADAPLVASAAVILTMLLVLAFNRTVGFFVLLAVSVHTFASYLGFAAFGPSGVPRANNVSGYVLESFGIFALGISCATATYWVMKPPAIRWKVRALNLHRLDLVAAIAALTGTAIVLYVILRVGFLEMVVSGNFVRYFGEEQAGSAFVLYQSLMRRGLAILAGSLPLVAVRWQATKSKALLLIVLTGVLAMSMTTRRGALAMVLLTIVATNVVLGKHRKAMLVVALLSVIAFLTLQSFFVPLLADSENPLVNTAAISATLMTEVNDFAWLLSEWNHHYFYGATYAAAIWPLPSTLSHFKDSYVLSSLTKDITGIPREAEHGGLRILIFGEGFLNFGYVGVIAIGILFGIVLRTMDAILEWARGGGASLMVIVMSLYILLCGLAYLSGTAIFSDTSLAILTMISVYFLSVDRRPSGERAY